MQPGTSLLEVQMDPADPWHKIANWDSQEHPGWLQCKGYVWSKYGVWSFMVPGLNHYIFKCCLKNCLTSLRFFNALQNKDGSGTMVLWDLNEILSCAGRQWVVATFFFSCFLHNSSGTILNLKVWVDFKKLQFSGRGACSRRHDSVVKSSYFSEMDMSSHPSTHKSWVPFTEAS
jgi:hypothetical protein